MAGVFGFGATPTGKETPAPLFGGAATPPAGGAGAAPLFGAATATPAAATTMTPSGAGGAGAAPLFGAAPAAQADPAAAQASKAPATVQAASISFGGAQATGTGPSKEPAAATPAAAAAANNTAASTQPLAAAAANTAAAAPAAGTNALVVPAGSVGQSGALYDATSLWWDPFHRLAVALEEAVRGLRDEVSLRAELDRFARFVADPASAFKPPSSEARAAISTTGKFGINGKAKAVAPGLRDAALAVSEHLELNEVQAYVLVVRCYRNGADGLPKSDPSMPEERARVPTRCESYYYTERRDLLFAIFNVLQLAKMRTDMTEAAADVAEDEGRDGDAHHSAAAENLAACEACADAVAKARSAGLEANLASALKAALGGPPAARAMAAMAGSLLSRGVAAGVNAAADWARAALREQCQLLEIVYAVGLTGQDNLQEMLDTLGAHVFGVDTNIESRTSQTAAAAALAAAEGEARAYTARREALAACLSLQLMGFDSLISRIGDEQTGTWERNVLAGAGAANTCRAVTEVVDKIAEAVCDAAVRTGAQAPPQARAVVCLGWACVLHLIEQLPEPLAGPLPSLEKCVEAATRGRALEWVTSAFSAGGALSTGAAGVGAGAHEHCMSEDARWMMRSVLSAHLASFVIPAPIGALLQPWSEISRTTAALAAVLDGAVEISEDIMVDNNSAPINQPINALLQQALRPFPEDPRPICTLLRSMCASERCAMDVVLYLDRAPTLALRHHVSDGTITVSAAGGSATLLETVDAQLAPGMVMRLEAQSQGTLLGVPDSNSGGSAIVAWNYPQRGIAVLLARLAGVVAAIVEARRGGHTPPGETVESALVMVDLLERAAGHNMVVAGQLVDCANACNVPFAAMIASLVATTCESLSTPFPGCLELLSAALRLASALSEVGPSNAFAALTAMPGLMTQQTGTAPTPPVVLMSLAALERSMGGKYLGTIAFLDASTNAMLNGHRVATDGSAPGDAYAPAMGWAAFANHVLSAYARWPHGRRATRWEVAAAAVRCLRVALQVAPGRGDELSSAAQQMLHPDGAAGAALAELLSAKGVETAAEHALGDGAGVAFEATICEALKLWTALANAAPEGAVVAPAGHASERAFAACVKHIAGRPYELKAAAASALVRLAERAPQRAALACDATKLAGELSEAVKGGRSTPRARLSAFVLEGLLDARSPLAYKLLSLPAGPRTALDATESDVKAANADAAEAATLARAARRSEAEAHVLPAVWDVARGASDGRDRNLQARMLRIALLLWLQGDSSTGAALWISKQEGAWDKLIEAVGLSAASAGSQNDVDSIDGRLAVMEAAALRILGAEAAQRPLGARNPTGVLSRTLGAWGETGVGKLLTRYQSQQPILDACEALATARSCARCVAHMLVPNAFAARDAGSTGAGPSIRPDVAKDLVEAAEAACKDAGVAPGRTRDLACAATRAAHEGAIFMEQSDVAARWGSEVAGYLNAARSASLEHVLLRPPRRNARISLTPEMYVYDIGWLEDALRACHVYSAGAALAEAASLEPAEADRELATAATKAIEAAEAAGHAASLADARTDALGAMRLLVAAALPMTRSGIEPSVADAANAWTWEKDEALAPLVLRQVAAASEACAAAAKDPGPMRDAQAIENSHLASLFVRALNKELLSSEVSAACVGAFATALGPPEAPARALDALAAATSSALGASPAPSLEASVLAESLRQRSVAKSATDGAGGTGRTLSPALASCVSAMLGGGGGGSLLALGLEQRRGEMGAALSPAQRMLRISRAVAVAASRTIEAGDPSATAAWFMSPAWSEALSAAAALVVEHAAVDDALLEEATSFAAAVAGGVASSLRISGWLQRQHYQDSASAQESKAAHEATCRACRLLAAMAPFAGRWALRAPEALKLVSAEAVALVADAGAAPMPAQFEVGTTVWAARKDGWIEASVVQVGSDNRPPTYTMRATGAAGDEFEVVACEARARVYGPNGAVVTPQVASAASATALAEHWRRAAAAADSAVGAACVFLARLAARSAKHRAFSDVLGAAPKPDALERVARALSARVVLLAGGGGTQGAALMPSAIAVARSLEAAVALVIPHSREGTVGRSRSSTIRDAVEAAAKALEGAGGEGGQLPAQLRATVDAL